MGLGRNEGHQGKLYVTWDDLPRSPGHVFYEKLQKILIKSKFDSFAELTPSGL